MKRRWATDEVRGKTPFDALAAEGRAEERGRRHPRAARMRSDEAADAFVGEGVVRVVAEVVGRVARDAPIPGGPAFIFTRARATRAGEGKTPETYKHAKTCQK